MTEEICKVCNSKRIEHEQGRSLEVPKECKDCSEWVFKPPTHCFSCQEEWQEGHRCPNSLGVSAK